MAQNKKVLNNGVKRTKKTKLGPKDAPRKQKQIRRGH